MKRQAALSSQIGENHPNRLRTMVQLATCYEKQRKLDEGIKLCNQIIEGFSTISYTEHPLQRKTQHKNKLIKERDAKKAAQHKMVITLPMNDVHNIHVLSFAASHGLFHMFLWKSCQSSAMLPNTVFM
jgi:hypothetical protein